MKLIRKILKGVSLTAAMFVFQACYGTMEDYYDTQVTFHVVDSDTGEPMKGIRIMECELNPNDSTVVGNCRWIADYTDENGMATIWTYDGMHLFSFDDTNSLYTSFDTIIYPNSVDTVKIVMSKAAKSLT